jgi:hypothetical protein
MNQQLPDGGWPSGHILRIPPPNLDKVEEMTISWRLDDLGTAVLLSDQHRVFTTASVVRALGKLSSMMRGSVPDEVSVDMDPRLRRPPVS